MFGDSTAASGCWRVRADAPAGLVAPAQARDNGKEHAALSRRTDTNREIAR